MEKFTWRKLCGVLGSFVGIILISSIDLTTQTDEDTSPDSARNRLFVRAIDDFPEKPASELALGDALALTSAVIYGIYTITLKRSTIKALPRQLNMSLFFGLVGAFNLILLLPLFPILHYTGLEPFELPPSGRIWAILLVNSVSSLFSDIFWAYAMVLTSPLLVTLGLSLTIPLSLVGEMVLQERYEGWIYWVGAAIVLGSFCFVDHEERGEEIEEVRGVALGGDSTSSLGYAEEAEQGLMPHVKDTGAKLAQDSSKKKKGDKAERLQTPTEEISPLDSDETGAGSTQPSPLLKGTP
jgi:solute carrier family 35 protein F5